MELFAPHAQVTLTMLALTGTVFGVLALVVKREAIGAAIRRVRGEFSTNLGLLLVNLVLLAPLFALPEGFIGDRIVADAALSDFWSRQNELVVLALAILLFDLVVYWRHRAAFPFMADPRDASRYRAALAFRPAQHRSANR